MLLQIFTQQSWKKLPLPPYPIAKFVWNLCNILLKNNAVLSRFVFFCISRNIQSDDTKFWDNIVFLLSRNLEHCIFQRLVSWKVPDCCNFQKYREIFIFTLFQQTVKVFAIYKFVEFSSSSCGMLEQFFQLCYPGGQCTVKYCLVNLDIQTMIRKSIS